MSITNNIAVNSVKLAMVELLCEQIIDDKTGLLERMAVEERLNVTTETADIICSLWAKALLEDAA